MSDAAALPPGVAEKVAAFRDGPGRNEPYALATVIRTVGANACRPGDRFVVTREGELIGITGGGCLRGAVRKAGLLAISEEKPHHIRILPRDKTRTMVEVGIDAYSSACPSKGEVDLFVEPVLPSPILFVFGASEVAQNVIGIARVAGFDVRPCSPDTLKLSGATHTSFAVVATQGDGDRAALEAAMDSVCSPILFVASRKKAAHWREALGQANIGEDRLSMLLAPAGLDLGASGPGEIAVSIVAQLILLRRRGNLS
ncbi:MAG: XdhC family protein [Sphingomonas sp.]|uniref:XdhC family protein n=1 Tax=Sphingomonas sp. TaxID=28214 RepID=UPI0035A8AECC|nr:XdhC /CoxI family-like protein [Parvibaculum sp.]MBY0305348.1 XdhC family protein [Sphingomonas sp.]